MISEERCAKALDFLTETDEMSAVLKAQVARKEYGSKVARSASFLLATGSVEARKAAAEGAERVQLAENELADAILEFEKVKARRITAALVVDVWRSVEASRRQGNV